MSLINEDFFIGELNIPGINKSDVQDRLDIFIEKYERKFLTEVLGYQLYKDFTDGLKVASVDPKWTKIKEGSAYSYQGRPSYWQGLVNGTQSPIANYVYYWWMRNEATQTTTLGEVIPKGENSDRTSNATKMARAWNEMVNEVWALVSFLDGNATDYPNWSWYGDTSTGYWMGYNYGRLKDVFYPINAYGL